MKNINYFRLNLNVHQPKTRQYFRLLNDSLNETEKHFYQIILSSNSSEELVLPDAAFWDITFDRFDQRASIRITLNNL